MTREIICSRIDDNIRQLKQEIELLRRRQTERTIQLNDLKRELAQIAENLPGPGVGRTPNRGSRRINQFDIFGAIGQALGNDQSRRIRELDAAIVDIEKELNEINIDIRNKERLLQTEQRDFTTWQCYNLGFSHEALNQRSADNILRA